VKDVYSVGHYINGDTLRAVRLGDKIKSGPALEHHVQRALIFASDDKREYIMLEEGKRHGVRQVKT
jgi:hypothetical protein